MKNLLNLFKSFKRFVGSLIFKKYVKDFFKKGYKKKVLLCYVLLPYINPSKKVFASHQNRRGSLILGEVFNELGYRVDIVDYKDAQTVNRINEEYYDIIFGIGDAFKAARETFKYGKCIFYATGLPSQLTNEAEEKRIDEVNAKYKTDFKPVRHQVVEFEDYSFIDAIVAMGNKNQLQNYKGIYDGPIYISNNLRHDYMPKPVKKNWEESRTSFFCVMSKGKILSGLDLIFEVFKNHPEWTLHMNMGFDGEEDFLEYFREYIYETPNIIYHGRNEVNTPEYNAITAKCVAFILPIVAAGQNGNAITCMADGMFPIISKECNVDLNNGGIFFESITEKGIENAIKKFLRLTEKEISKVCIETQKDTINRYSIESTKSRLKEIFKDI